MKTEPVVDPIFVKETAFERAFNVKSEHVVDPLLINTNKNTVEKTFNVKSEIQYNEANNTIHDVFVKEELFPKAFVSKCIYFIVIKICVGRFLFPMHSNKLLFF